MMRSTKVLWMMGVLLSVGGCDCLMDKVGEAVGEQVAEEIIGHAAGGKNVDIEEGRVVMEGEDGERVVWEKDGEGVKGVVVGKDGKKVNYQSGKDGMRIEGEDGTTVIGAKTVPEGFPLPVPDGAKIASSMSADKGEGKREFMVAMNVEAGKLDALDSFYKKALEDAGYEVKRTTMQMGPQSSVTLNGKKDGSQANAMLMQTPEKPGVTIMLTVKGK